MSSPSPSVPPAPSHPPESLAPNLEIDELPAKSPGPVNRSVGVLLGGLGGSALGVGCSLLITGLMSLMSEMDEVSAIFLSLSLMVMFVPGGALYGSRHGWRLAGRQTTSIWEGLPSQYVVGGRHILSWLGGVVAMLALAPFMFMTAMIPASILIDDSLALGLGLLVVEFVMGAVGVTRLSRYVMNYLDREIITLRS